jgi:predicted permease
VLAFTLLVCLVTGLIFGLAPALRISRTDLNEPLKETGRTTGSSAGSRRLRDILCAFEMVLATVLLIGAGLLVRSLHNAEAASPGFQPENVALAAFDLQAASYSDEKASIYFDQLLARVRGLPGVESASLEQYVPLWFYGRGASHVDIEGYTPKPNEYMGIEFNVVGPEYFHTLEIPLVQGRDFSEQDRPGAPKSVIINQTMANRFWPQQSAVGHHIHLWGDWRTVVGVARDIKYHRMNEPPESFVYLPSLQAGSTDANLLVRSRGSSSALLGAIRWEAKSLDPRVQPLETDNLSDLLRVSLFANRMAASLATILGALGMLLAALGIYGVLSYTISQRVREIGIRMALGAQSADILQLVIGQGLRLAVAGAAAGAVISLILTRWMTTLLFGVSPTDPTTFAIVILLVTGVSVLAAYIPARRAMRMDPMVALRYE